ncbi:hypothetical protein SASPL_144977 [Salvia splendens]|uniref:non-specific serine/threonine protein kinase n=1 Tax=Salvia splendens TaxID=180675 RepID=A0A8X8Z7N4_SALSN|nr:hypothetical protein SASPL_144977 [Salvia splendens]
MSGSPSSSSGSEEEDEGIDSYRKGGYHAVRIADNFSAGRYIAQKKLGWGQFSTVWLAYDTESSKYVALKIQKSAPQFSQAAIHEIEILSAVAAGDPSNDKCTVRLVDHFKHAGPNGQHLCMVLEFLGDSLLSLIKYNRYKGLEFHRVREISRCILTALDYLHRELRIIHTDLKPENILLCSNINPSKDPIRSGVTPVLERPEGNPNGGVVISSIEKRLKQRAKRAVARISERRIAFELATGEMMFTPKTGQGFSEDEDHLAMMMEFLGKIPRKIATSGARSKEYFDRYGDLKRIRRLKYGSIDRLLVDKYKFSDADAREFAGFLSPMLDFDPDKRPTAQQCLQHPWLNADSETSRLNAGMNDLEIKAKK